MKFGSAKEVSEFRRDLMESARAMKEEFQRHLIVDLCAYAGKQWRKVTRDTFNHTGGVARLPVNNNPSTADLRVVKNVTTAMVQKAVASTFPAVIDVEVRPPDADAGPEATVRAQVFEDALNALVEKSGYTENRRDANFQRGIWSSFGLGWAIRARKRALALKGQDVTLAETDLVAFTFDPTMLTLDPFCRSRNLSEHEVVILSRPWTFNKLQAFLGDTVELDKEKMRTIGDICSFQVQCHEISDMELFAQYQTHSTTKGAMVHEIFVRDDYGRFAQMFTEVELGSDEPRIVNFENPENPFGGNGMALALFHGHRRTDGPYGISDARMLKDNQDKVNLNETLTYRGLNQYHGNKVTIDRATLDRNTTDESVRNNIADSVGGVFFYSSGTRDRPGHPPELLKYPQPPAFMAEMAKRYQDDMLVYDVHRAPVNLGLTKTHVSNEVVENAIEQSDQVLGTRVTEDVEVDAHLLRVALGTIIKQVKQMSPCTLGMLRAAHMDEMALATLYESDPVAIDATVRIREGSVRYESPKAKKQSLNESLVNKAISPAEYRQSRARDLDMAVTQEDKYFSDQADRAAAELLRGTPWEPVPLGPKTEWFLSAFRRALLDRKAKANPAIKQLVVQAIQGQQLVAMQEAAMLQAAQGGAPQDAGAAASGGAGMDANASFDQIVSQLESQAGGAPTSAQPEPALV